MNIFIGKEDRFAINGQFTRGGPLGTTTRYSKPNLIDPFFSKYGFCVPLDKEGTPIEYLLDKELEFNVPGFEKLPIGYRFLRISPKGKIFRVLIQSLDKEDFYHQRPVLTSCGWWMICDKEENDKFKDLLSGFLYSDPSEKQVSEFFYKYNLGEELQWYGISEIVKTYNERYS